MRLVDQLDSCAALPRAAFETTEAVNARAELVDESITWLSRVASRP